MKKEIVLFDRDFWILVAVTGLWFAYAFGTKDDPDEVAKRNKICRVAADSVTERIMRKVPYPSPGEILLEEFLKPMGITQYRLAKEIGVSQRRIGEIVAGNRSVTADTGLRLSKFFNMSEGFWVGLQLDYDAAQTKDKIAAVLSKIKPWQPSAHESALA